ncbi:hypothetical protein Ahy_A03g011242 [Arachis hypogaea]|uniref:Aminotransferase-like plant mobile domain-containing protein n=1 Tax=Arachis hypogaea TaxID=3818 RepID=A0A445DQ54_ARAHY|nr:hypothetical protein Ahy_A03g011242 [Arachis hypogaea]
MDENVSANAHPQLARSNHEMEMVYTSRRVSTKWDHGTDTNHFVPGTKEMQHVKLGVHDWTITRMASTKWGLHLWHTRNGPNQVCHPRVGNFMGGTHEMAILKCGRHEMGVQSKQQLRFLYEHALGESEAIYCWVVSLKHIKGGYGRGGDQSEGKKRRSEVVGCFGEKKEKLMSNLIIKKMSGSGINVEENLNRLDEFHISAHLHVKPARVLISHGTLVDWLRSRLQQMPLDSPEEALVRYARCYIMYLLGGVLLPDKANNTVHVRYLPLLANYEAISTYSWGSAVLCWLYRGMCLATDYNIEGMSGCHTLLMSWIYFRLPFWAPA